MDRFIITRLIRVLASLMLGLSPICANADPAISAHPGLESSDAVFTRQLGDFGESFVHAGLRARGFQVINGNVGGTGIDRIAIKRAVDGTISEIRYIEVKTRQMAPDFQLAVTKNNGTQLSEQWTQYNLRRMATGHSDEQVRAMAKELLESSSARPQIIHRELHGISVASDRYVIQCVDDTGRVVGVAADGRLTSLLKMLSRRGTSAETRAAATRHLAQFDQLQTTATGMREPVLTRISAEGTAGIGRSTPATANLKPTETAVIVEDAAAAKNWFTKLSKQPGVMAGGITFVVDQGFTGWQYHQGNISSADAQRQTGQNGLKAGIVGAATQLVYILAPTPHGLVLIAVGVVAYVAADQAIEAYDDALVPKAPAAVELRGIIPDACAATPMIDDVAAGQVRRSTRVPNPYCS